MKIDKMYYTEKKGIEKGKTEMILITWVARSRENDK